MEPGKFPHGPSKVPSHGSKSNKRVSTANISVCNFRFKVFSPNMFNVQRADSSDRNLHHNLEYRLFRATNCKIRGLEFFDSIRVKHRFCNTECNVFINEVG